MGKFFFFLNIVNYFDLIGNKILLFKNYLKKTFFFICIYLFLFGGFFTIFTHRKLIEFVNKTQY
jgi:hypothetical protein